MKQIFFALILVATVYFAGKYSFTVPESATTLLLFLITTLFSLLSLFIYQTKKDMAKIQKTLDDLIIEQKGNTEVLENKNDPLLSGQQAINEGVEETQWDELEQSEKDAHIAKIQKTMVYTGSSSHSRQETDDPYGTIQIDTNYEIPD